MSVDPVWGKDWIQTYLSVGDNYSKDNKQLHIGFMLALLGQSVPKGHFYLGDSKNHVRINPIMIQNSGTGKDPAFDFAKAVARETSITFCDSNAATEAGFVGSFDKEGEEVPGIARTKDLIGFREAMLLFKSTKATYNNTLAENINNVVDGKAVERSMANGIITIDEPTCSIVATTYPPSKDDLDVENLFQNGGLARFLWFYRDVSRQERNQMMREVFTAPEPNPDEIYQRVGELGATLRKIEMDLKGEPRFTFDFHRDDLYDQVSELQLQSLESAPERVANTVEPAMGRYAINTLRIACLMAALDECSTVVTDDHVETALEIVNRSWCKLIEFVSHYFGEITKGGPSNELIMAGLLKSADEPMTQEDLLKKLPVTTERSIRRYASHLEKVGLIETIAGSKKKPTMYKAV